RLIHSRALPSFPTRRSSDLLRDTDNAKARYQEVIDHVLGNIPDTKYYTEANGKLIKDRITLEGNDWTFTQHVVIDPMPTEEDFKKTVADYLSWKVSQIMQDGVSND